MNISISYSSGKPMYEQIEDFIRAEVLSGKLTHNQPMPSVRHLAADLNISTITIKRAYADLEREGVLYTISGKGTFVRLEDMDRLRDEREKLLLSGFEEKISELHSAGIARERLLEIIRRYYEEL